MKKLILAGAIALSSLAFAGDKPVNEKPVNAVDVGSQMKNNASDWERQAGVKHDDSALFSASKTYDLDGTVSKVQFGKITIAREGLPDAVLNLKDATKITVDGRAVDAKLLSQGTPVRASFQLDGSAAAAIKIDATLAKDAPPAR